LHSKLDQKIVAGPVTAQLLPVDIQRKSNGTLRLALKMKGMYNSDGGAAANGEDVEWTARDDPVVGNVGDPVEEEVLHKHVHDEDLVGGFSVGIEGVGDGGDSPDEDSTHHDSLEESTDVGGCADLDKVPVPKHTDTTADGRANHVDETELGLVNTLVHLCQALGDGIGSENHDGRADSTTNERPGTEISNLSGVEPPGWSREDSGLHDGGGDVPHGQETGCAR